MALQSKLFSGDAKLDAAAVSDPAHILSGASGPHVTKIQQALIQLDGATLTPDGKYGPATAAAVSAFKQKRQILNTQGKIDNIVGKKTIAALDSEMLAKEKGGVPGGSRRGILGDEVRGGISVSHMLVFFSGASSNSAQDGLAASPVDEEVFGAMRDIRVQPPEDTIVIGFNGSNTTLKGVDEAELLINEVRDPNGKLIIYGFSAGAINALKLCRRLLMRVDLLVTVDVSDGTPTSPGVNTDVPSNVAVNRNFFQQVFLPTGVITIPGVGRILKFNARGRETTGSAGKFIPTKIGSPPLSISPRGKSPHGQMATLTQNDAIGAMNDELKRK